MQMGGARANYVGLAESIVGKTQPLRRYAEAAREKQSRHSVPDNGALAVRFEVISLGASALFC